MLLPNGPFIFSFSELVVIQRDNFLFSCQHCCHFQSEQDHSNKRQLELQSVQNK